MAVVIKMVLVADRERKRQLGQTCLFVKKGRRGGGVFWEERVFFIAGGTFLVLVFSLFFFLFDRNINIIIEREIKKEESK
jgi:hypothetical protein